MPGRPAVTSRAGASAATMERPPGPSPVTGADVGTRLADVQARIAAAARRSGRDPGEVQLVAVSKTVEPARIVAAHRAGQVDFGENRAQELRRKRDAVDAPVRWHFIGRLQRNKVRDVVGVDLIHSVDSMPLAEAIARAAQRHGVAQRVLLPVNSGEDPAKAGCTPADAPGLIERIRDLSGIRCEGLMAIPPMGADPRPTFRRLAELRERLPRDVQQLSMGMSRDFEVAVEEGATIVRLGEAVFGRRPPPRAATAADRTEKE